MGKKMKKKKKKSPADPYQHPNRNRNDNPAQQVAPPQTIQTARSTRAPQTKLRLTREEAHMAENGYVSQGVCVGQELRETLRYEDLVLLLCYQGCLLAPVSGVGGTEKDCAECTEAAPCPVSFGRMPVPIQSGASTTNGSRPARHNVRR